MALGLGIVVYWATQSGPAAAIVSAFKSRVIADGGTVESPSCAKSDVKFLLDNPEPVDFTGLLNDYSGAAAAYSLRLLDNTYSGNAIKVRRSSDNAEQDIAFTNNELDTASLETFASGTDAFVTTWYDQSGNGVDAANSNASSQPKIVSSGSTILENGKAAVEFDNTDDYLDTISTINVSNSSYFIVAQMNASISSQDYSYIFSNHGSTRQSLAKRGQGTDTDKLYVYDGTASHIDGLHSLSQEMISLFFPLTPPYLDMYVDGSASSFGSLPNGSKTFNDKISIGRFQPNNTHFFDGHLQEFILYNSDETSNRTGIETNINDFYSIY